MSILKYSWALHWINESTRNNTQSIKAFEQINYNFKENQFLSNNQVEITIQLLVALNELIECKNNFASVQDVKLFADSLMNSPRVQLLERPYNLST